MLLFKYIIILITALLLQTTIFSYLTIFGITPDFLLIIVVLSGPFLGPGKGTVLGLGAGLLQDVLISIYAGVYMIVKTGIGLISGLIGDIIFEDNFIIPVILIFGVSIFQLLIVDFFTTGTGFSTGVFDLIFSRGFPEAAVNSVVGLFLYPVFYKIFKFGDKKYG